MTGYFSSFPQVTWANTVLVNIACRTDITRRVRGNPRNFYPLSIREGLRADRIAQAYYGDPFYAWLVYVSGDVLDPYYGWVMDNQAFSDYITSKYGSVVLAQQQIHHWQVDWASFSDQSLTLSAFNALDANTTKYYTPVYSYGATIIGYQLRRVDWTETTNQTVVLNVTNTISGNGFLLDEPVFVINTTSNVAIGNGQVCWTNSSFVTIQHVTGNVTANSTHLYGVISGTSANIISNAPPYYNIPLDEQVFWGPISCYEYETNLNEQNRNIAVVDARYAPSASNELRSLLNPNTSTANLASVLKILTQTTGG